MQDTINEFCLFPVINILPGKPVEIPIFIKMPLNKTIIEFAERGKVIGVNEIATLRGLPADRLLCLKSDMSAWLNKERDEMINSIKNNDGEALTSNVPAQNILNALDLSSTAVNMVDYADSLLNGILALPNKVASAEDYKTIYEELSNTEGDLLEIHHKYVSLISTLMALSLGGFQINEIHDITLAAVVHDLGLKALDGRSYNFHLAELSALAPHEVNTYHSHVEQTMQIINKLKTPLTVGAKRIIQQHHECWSGTGKEGLAGAKIYRGARVVRIADDIVSAIQCSRYAIDIPKALSAIQKNSGHYDPSMVQELSGKMIFV